MLEVALHSAHRHHYRSWLSRRQRLQNLRQLRTSRGLRRGPGRHGQMTLPRLTARRRGYRLEPATGAVRWPLGLPHRVRISVPGLSACAAGCDVTLQTGTTTDAHPFVPRRQLHHLISLRVPAYRAETSSVLLVFLLFLFYFFSYIFSLYHHLFFYFPTSCGQLVGCGRLGSGLRPGEVVVQGKNGLCYSFGYSSPWNTQRKCGNRNAAPPK